MPFDYRAAVRLIARNGGRLVRHGASHDVFVTRDGTQIIVPRHPGDLSRGVERDIKKKLGLL